MSEQDSSCVASSTSGIFSQTSSIEEAMDDTFEPGRKFKGLYSLLKVPRYSMELIRGDESSNLWACLANTFLLDIQYMHFLTSFKSNNYDLIQVKFELISGLLDHFYLPAGTMDDLNGDQWLLLEYAVAISQGKVNPIFASWKVGPLNQARWLTLAISLICLWIRGENSRAIVQFVIQVYAVCWFEIKKGQ